MRWDGGKRCYGTVTMATWISTITPRNARCVQLFWEGRIIYFMDRMLEANAQRQSTA